jgi:hypothetical protein
MKKRIRILCLILALSLLTVFPVHAESNAEPRASAFFSSYLTVLNKASSTTIEIWFDVTANAAVMQELGASMIELYESADGQSWTIVETYEKEDYPNMIDYNTGSHTSYVTYDNAISGYYYSACVTYYAKNSTGIGKRFIYTETLQM